MSTRRVPRDAAFQWTCRNVGEIMAVHLGVAPDTPTVRGRSPPARSGAPS
jgi:hypothetical protein